MILDSWNYAKQRLGITASTGSQSMRISVSGGVITATGGSTTNYPAALVGKTIEIWATGGAGTLLDQGDAYSFDANTGQLSQIADGNYLIILF
ncbi:MAG: hypothetical protein KatS3mg031_0194 [Chitinophagales bacterium]|nr:MAG: hypothetical protein KatS3mg031_0194 [Chitinophagales bacterium]